MNLPRCESMITALKDKLFEHDSVLDLPLGILAICRVEHSDLADQNNQKDPRSFAFTQNIDIGKILCSQALEYVAPETRAGVLLHEIGHVVLNAFGDDGCEVQVDRWCVFVDRGFTYRDTHYRLPDAGLRTARHVECVSEEFLKGLEIQ